MRCGGTWEGEMTCPKCGTTFRGYRAGSWAWELKLCNDCRYYEMRLRMDDKRKQEPAPPAPQSPKAEAYKRQLGVFDERASPAPHSADERRDAFDERVALIERLEREMEDQKLKRERYHQAYSDECKKFQAETLRTRELSREVERLEAELAEARAESEKWKGHALEVRPGHPVYDRLTKELAELKTVGLSHEGTIANLRAKLEAVREYNAKAMDELKARAERWKEAYGKQVQASVRQCDQRDSYREMADKLAGALDVAKRGLAAKGIGNAAIEDALAEWAKFKEGK